MINMNSQPFDYYKNKGVEYDFILQACVKCDNFNKDTMDELNKLIFDEDFLGIYFPQVCLGGVYTKYNFQNNKLVIVFGITSVDKRDEITTKILIDDINNFIVSLNKNISQTPKLNIKEGDIEVDIVTENKEILDNIDKKLVSENKLILNRGNDRQYYYLTDDGIVEQYKNSKLESSFAFSKLGVIRECKKAFQEGYTLLTEIDNVKDLDEVVNNAIHQAEITGYTQYIYVDDEDNYSFSTLNDEKFHNNETYIGEVTVYWENSILKAKFVPAVLNPVTEATIPNGNDALDNTETLKDELQQSIDNVDEIQQLKDELEDKLSNLTENTDNIDDTYVLVLYSNVNGNYVPDVVIKSIENNKYIVADNIADAEHYMEDEANHYVDDFNKQNADKYILKAVKTADLHSINGLYETKEVKTEDTHDKEFPSTDFTKRQLSKNELKNLKFINELTIEQVAWIQANIGNVLDIEQSLNDIANTIADNDDEPVISVDEYIAKLQKTLNGGIE